MNIIITDEMLEKTCLYGHTLTNSPTFEWKTRMRIFKTPFKLARYSKTSQLCRRNCGKVGDHTHIFWDCSKLYKYWKDI